MKRPRFSLRAFLIAITGVAIFFGIARIHRRNVLASAKEFEELGATVEFRDDWIDHIWMRKPKRITVSSESLGFFNGIKLLSTCVDTGIWEIKVAEHAGVTVLALDQDKRVIRAKVVNEKSH